MAASRDHYYMIRQESTGFLFPATGRGSTDAEFTPHGVPRLFHSRHAAKQCLDWWLKGSTKAIRTGGGAWEDFDEYLETTPRPERLSHKYEIIKVALTVVTEAKATEAA